MSETQINSTSKAARVAGVLTKLALVLGVLCAIASVASGLGSRFDIWHFRIGFTILKYATYVGFAVVAFALIGLIIALVKNLKSVRSNGLIALALGVIVVGPPLYQVYLSKQVPAIHDISTDTVNPPVYAAVPALRTQDDNSLAPDPATVKQQLEAFPDIKTDVVAIAPAQALSRAEAVARAMGWDIVAVDSKAMQVEATARTLLFGFKDDVAIRVTPEGTGSRIDVRSASRVGRSDLGVNARRIREYLKQFNASNAA